MFGKIIRWFLSWSPEFALNLMQSVAEDHDLVIEKRSDYNKFTLELYRLQNTTKSGPTNTTVLIATKGPKKGRFTSVPAIGTRLVPQYPPDSERLSCNFTPPSGWGPYFEAAEEYASTLLPAKQRAFKPGDPTPKTQPGYGAMTLSRQDAIASGYSPDNTHRRCETD